MSNRNRKVKPQTMADVKLAKAKEQIARLGEQVNASQMQVLNIRQMYEAVVQEKQAIYAQLVRATQIVIGAAIQSKGKLVLKEKTFPKLAGYIGFHTETDGGDLVVTVVEAPTVEAEDVEA